MDKKKVLMPRMVGLDQYVHFKDMVFDIIEGKLSIEDAKIQMHGLERGYDK